MAVSPFGASRAGALALVPEARLIRGDDPPPAGSYGITEFQVDRWVVELSGNVSMRLDDWQRLSDTPREPETTSDRDQLIQAARTVIHNGVASYIEAARHPEQATPNATSYATILWDRYIKGLEQLETWLAGRLAAADANDAPDTETTGGAAWSFPLPTFVDRFPV